MKRVRKVVTYITEGNSLLVFRHRDFPEVGLQVPAGTVEENEELERAALREAAEETGLKNFGAVRYLGTSDYDISVLRPEIHERHFFHLEALPPVPKEWVHFETSPSGGDGKPIAFNCFWIDRKEADSRLFLGFGEMLGKIYTEQAA